MGFPLLKRGCFCCKLKTGSIVIAVISLLASGVWVYEWFNDIEDTYHHIRSYLYMKEVLYEWDYTIAGAVAYLPGAFFVIHGLVSIMLMIGICQGQLTWMRVYCVFGIVIIGIIMLNTMVAISFKDEHSKVLVSALLEILLQAYYIWVIFSYAEMVEREKKRAKNVPLSNVQTKNAGRDFIMDTQIM